MTDINLIDVNKTYPPDIRAVENVNLHIRDGEFMILLGPSGCGKSTTLRMIAGLESITSGDLYLADRRINDVDPRDRNLAIVFQNYALYPHMSVRANLSFGMRLRRRPAPEIDKRVNEVAELLGIGTLLDRRPGALSGGQRQRVALGRALVREPIAFLFDEPLSNLDAKLRASMRTELVKLHQKLGTTIIHVTHDQVEAMTMGQRICVMREGRVIQVGAPLEVYRNPVDTFVAGFLASPPMNLLDARVVEQPVGGFAVEHGAVMLPVPPAYASACAPLKDRPVILGIRPEDIYEAPVPGSSEIDLHVVAIEALGPETILIAAIPGGGELAARLGRGFAARLGAEQRLHVDVRHLHLFDPETRRAVERTRIHLAPQLAEPEGPSGTGA